MEPSNQIPRVQEDPNTYSSTFNSKVESFSKKTKIPDEIKMVISGASSGLKVAELFVDTSGIAVLKGGVSTIKTVTSLAEITQVMNSIFNPVKQSFTTLIVNISGVGLFVLNGLSFTEKLGYADLSILTDRIAELPVAGLFPFGGALKIFTLGAQGGLLTFDLEERTKNNEKRAQIAKIKKEKITYWKETLTKDKIQQKIEDLAWENADNPDPKFKEKIQKWEKIRDLFETGSADKIQAFRKAKIQKWENKEKKVALEVIATNCTIVKRGVSITFNVIEVGLTVSVVGGLAATVTSVVSTAVEFGFGFAAYKCKSNSKAIEIKPVDPQNFLDAEGAA